MKKLGIITKIIRWVVAAFFGSTILVVVLYRFLPVYYTPLMFIRCFQQAAEGETMKKHGASTISQQTAKNVFLWPGRSWVRKGFEAYFTVLIEFMWSKQRIMEVYLNSIEMGDGIYGVDAVATDNFQTTAADLSRADCALIAATLPNPRKFSSKDPGPYMRKRRSQIEQQMKFIPSFPKEGEDINPETSSGGIYRNRKR